MVFYRGLKLLLLDTDISLGDGGAAVLQELLDQGHIIAVGLVNLGCEEFPKTVGADPLEAEEIADKFQMLLNLPLREREKRLVLPDAVVLAVDPDPLIQREGYGKLPLLAGFLLRDGQAVAAAVFDDVRETQAEDIRDAEAEVGLQHQGGGDPGVRLRAGESLPHGLDDFPVLILGQGDGVQDVECRLLVFQNNVHVLPFLPVMPVSLQR